MKTFNYHFAAQTPGTFPQRFLCAFTLIEVLAALIVVACSILGLIRLHLLTINITNHAQLTQTANLLAQQKIAESLAADSSNIYADSGIINKNGTELHWQKRLTDAHLPRLNQQLANLHQLTVDVSWKQASHEKHLSLTTYIAEDK